MNILKHCRITKDKAFLNGEPVNVTGDNLLVSLYREKVGDYPKFFKMDVLCKLGFVASELILADDAQRFEPREDRAVLLFTKNGPLCNDKNFFDTIGAENYFPSPSLFVYTLANIVTGEIAIRNKYEGDTTAFALPEFDARLIVENVKAAFEDKVTSSAICGWIDCSSETDFEAVIMLVEKEGETLPFNEKSIEKIYGTY